MPEQSVYASIGHQLFLMNHVKKPLMEGVQVLADVNSPRMAKLGALRKLWGAYQNFLKLPPPTIEPGPGQVFHPDALNILRLRDRLIRSCHLAEIRMTFVLTVFSFASVIVEMDPPWRFIARNTREAALGMEWAPPDYCGQPTGYPWWTDDIKPS